MPPPRRRHLPTGDAHLEWVLTDDGSRTLFDTRLAETFHSGCGAVSETLIVYLFNSGVVDRLRAGQATRVLEYGLGTATGVLLTAALAECYRTKLVYHALEQSLLAGKVFQQLDLPAAVAGCLAGGHARSPHFDPRFSPEQFAALPLLIAQFQQQLSVLGAEGEAALPSTHVFSLGQFVEVHLLLGDARTYAPRSFDGQAGGDRAGGDDGYQGFNAIYFDPFSPETNPELWTATVFRQAAATLAPGGSFTSYCVKGSVRRQLQAAGLQVTRLPGPLGGKREVLLARASEPCVPGGGFPPQQL